MIVRTLRKEVEIRQLTNEDGADIAAWIGGTWSTPEYRTSVGAVNPEVGYLHGPQNWPFGCPAEKGYWIGKRERPGREPKVYMIEDLPEFMEKKGWVRPEEDSALFKNLWPVHERLYAAAERAGQEEALERLEAQITDPPLDAIDRHIVATRRMQPRSDGGW